MKPLAITPVDAGVELPYLPVVRLWLLRVLVRGSDRAQLLLEDCERSDQILHVLGLDRSKWLTGDSGSAKEVLQSQLIAAERRRNGLPVNTRLAAEIRRAAARSGMSDVEQDILHFVCLVGKCAPLATTLDALGGLSLGRLFQLVGLCLGIPMGRARAALEKCRIPALLASIDVTFSSAEAKLPGIWGTHVNTSSIYFQ